MEYIEREYNKAIEYLSKRYSVRVHNDFISKPNKKNTQDKLCKISNGQSDIMWAYLKLGRKLYASIETDPVYIEKIRDELTGFDDIIERESKPKLKLIFTDFDKVKDSVKRILDAIDDYTGIKTSKEDSINVPMLPKQIIENKKDYEVICGRCESTFIKSNRCTNCGQMLEWPNDDELSKYLIRPMNQKRKLEDIYEWAKVTSLGDISRAQAIEIAERFMNIGFGTQVGTTDVNMVYQREDGKKMYGFFFFGDARLCGFQPSEFITYVTEHGIDEKIVTNEFLEDMRCFLSKKQKNVPYDYLKGYYFIDLLTVYEHLDEIVNIYSKLIKKIEGNK